TSRDLWISVVLSVGVVLFFVLFYNRLFAVTFDEDFAKATGVRTDMYNLLIAVVIAIIIVLSMKLVGSLLITALVIFPALSSMRIFKDFKKVTLFSAIFSVICATLGILVSILWGTPVGATVVAVDTLGFALCCAIGAAGTGYKAETAA
ncbi:MAG: metal ABC transporter permease, partial [Firmicutes bacterium]|nr:metal ABC transporter permease [Bacillota bacterium]